MIRAIDGHGRAESQTAQDNGKVAPATPGTEAKETESTEDMYDENDNKPGIAAEEVLRREYDAQEDSRKLEEAHIMSIGEDDTHWGFDALTVHIRPRPLGRGAATVYGARAATGRHRRLPGRRCQQHTHTPSRRREAHTLHTHTSHTQIHAGCQESCRGARKPTHAHPPPTPDHPFFPDTPHQGRSACSPCSIGAHVFNRKNTNPLRCAAGRHAHIDSGS